MPRIEHLLTMLWVSFNFHWLCFKHVHKKLLYPCSLPTAKAFVARAGNELMWGCPVTTMMQVASMPLELVSYLGIFLFCKCPVSSIFWQCFEWALIFIDYVLNTSTKNCYILVHYLPPRLLLLELGMNLCEVVPCHHDDASCFDASRISINKSVGDFPWYMFSETAVLPESPDCRPRALT